MRGHRLSQATQRQQQLQLAGLRRSSGHHHLVAVGAHWIGRLVQLEVAEKLHCCYGTDLMVFLQPT